MAIERSNRRLAAARIAATAQQLLDASTLCTIATVTLGGRAHINTAYFAWGRDFEIVWFSEPRATHSRNLRANKSAAIAVYDSSQTWGKPDRGIQLFGPAGEAGGEEDDEARALYAKRFPAFADADLSAYRFYRFQARSQALRRALPRPRHVRDGARSTEQAARMAANGDLSLGRLTTPVCLAA